jgi:DNA-binding transcriptional LysR family regulator
MLDIELLHSFVSVVEAGGFTQAGARVHRTQSTVSQQIKRLEESVGRPLFNRSGRRVALTEEGEHLLSYARRILALASEAHDAVAHAESLEVVRLGVTEDFAAYHLPRLLGGFTRSRAGLRLDVRCGVSVDLLGELSQGELDLAIVKRETGDRSGVCAWPERLIWIASRQHSIEEQDPVALAVFGQGCLYRNRAIHALESIGRAWRIAYSSPNLAGVQAAVSAGLGISVLPNVAVLPGHRQLTRADGFPTLRNTEVALLTAPNPTAHVRELAEQLIAFCNVHAIRGAGTANPSSERRAG